MREREKKASECSEAKTAPRFTACATYETSEHQPDEFEPEDGNTPEDTMPEDG